jgi:hypothetical protein
VDRAATGRRQPDESSRIASVVRDIVNGKSLTQFPEKLQIGKLIGRL